jgi:oligo-1,6-glucosidase
MLQGTPYIYQGEEIGMTNVAFESIGDYRDIETLNMYREAVEEQGLDPHAVMAKIHVKSRDNARTPMQWDASEHAGFTSGTPWIKVNPNYPAINVEQALADPQSIFAYYQALIRLRKANPVMVYGTYDLLLDDHQEIYAFTRTLLGERLLVILNFTRDTPIFALPSQIAFAGAELLIGNYAVDPAEDVRRLALRPFEARVYRLV